MRGSAIALSLLVPFLLVLTTLGGATAQPSQLQVLSYSSYTDSLGYYHVVGEVLNAGTETLSQVTVAASICDQTGHTIATVEDYIMIDLLVSQQKSPFDLFENSTGTVCSVTPANSAVADKLPYHDFQITSQSTARDAEGLYHVSGQVENTGASEGQAVDVIATFYDSNGVVVQAGSTGTTPSNLSAGGNGYFDVSTDDPTLSNQIANFSLQVQAATPTLPIPEYPIIAPILALSLAIVTIAGPRKSRDREKVRNVTAH